MAPALAIGPHETLWATQEWRFEPMPLPGGLRVGHLLVVPFAGDHSVIVRSNHQWSLPRASLAVLGHWQPAALALLRVSARGSVLAVTPFGAIVPSEATATVLAWAEVLPGAPGLGAPCVPEVAVVPHRVASTILAPVPLLAATHELALAFRANACSRPCDAGR